MTYARLASIYIHTYIHPKLRGMLGCLSFFALDDREHSTYIQMIYACVSIGRNYKGRRICPPSRLLASVLTVQFEFGISNSFKLVGYPLAMDILFIQIL